MGKFKTFSKWCVVIAGLPLTYLILPISCCVRNPASKVFNERPPKNVEECMQENLKTGLVGMITIATCGLCCCGYCCEIDPHEI